MGTLPRLVTESSRDLMGPRLKRAVKVDGKLSPCARGGIVAGAFAARLRSMRRRVSSTSAGVSVISECLRRIMTTMVCCCIANQGLPKHQPERVPKRIQKECGRAASRSHKRVIGGEWRRRGVQYTRRMKETMASDCFLPGLRIATAAIGGFVRWEWSLPTEKTQHAQPTRHGMAEGVLRKGHEDNGSDQWGCMEFTLRRAVRRSRDLVYGYFSRPLEATSSPRLRAWR